MSESLLGIENPHQTFATSLPGLLCEYVGMHVRSVQDALRETGLNPSISTIYDVVGGTSKGRPGIPYLRIRDGVLEPAVDLYSDRCSSCPIAECDVRRRLGSEYIISTEEGESNSNTQYVWFPGISVDSRTTYKKVLGQLSPEVSAESGHTFVDYPLGEYNPVKFDETFRHLIESLKGKKIKIIATSFGAGEVSRVLSQNPELQEDIDSLLLLGAIYKNDGYNGMLRKLREKLEEGDPSVKYLKSLSGQLGFDSGYLEEDEKISAFLGKNSKGIQGYAARIKSFMGARNLSDLGDNSINIPTKLMWFEEDYILASPFQRKAFARKFTNVELDTSSLKGKHSTVATNAVPIAQAIAALS